MKSVSLTVFVLIVLKDCFSQNFWNNQSPIRNAEQHLSNSNSYYNRLQSNDYLDKKNISPFDFLFGSSSSSSSTNVDSDVEDLARINHKRKIKNKKKKNKLSHFNQLQLLQRQQQQLLHTYTDPCRYVLQNRQMQDNFDDRPEGRFFWDLNIYNIYPKTQQYEKPYPYPIPILLNGCNNLTPQNNGLSLAGLSNIPLNGNRVGHAYNPNHQHSSILNTLLNNVAADNNYNNNPIDSVYDDNVRPIQEDDNGEEPESTSPSSTVPIRQFAQLVGGVSNRINDVIQILSGNGNRGPLIKRSNPTDIRQYY